MDIEQAMEKVAVLDFSKLKQKLQATEGWSSESTNEAEHLYRKFLALVMTYPDRKLGPSRVMDHFWHAHILDTRAYTSDCEMLFGHYLHHYPYGGTYGDVLDIAISDAAYKNTCDLFLKHFDIVL
ncbi:MAG: hypothetical protein OXE41_12465 [Gammaproteobacteria bacterium]|nr:hypothetical protein [Gammaproteobacteria bacterium]MCY4219720.1 hypothetical protein [Gammaproteobacteria bacterium]MCY4276182.1 hypothetical protein [Gammaproteobacteria bacterium]